MITDFDDFCTWVFVIVDDIWKTIVPFFKRPGPKPECSDSELIAMTLIGECRGWHMANRTAELLARVYLFVPTHSYPKPLQPTETQFDEGD